jgi:hypothetical protein
MILLPCRHPVITIPMLYRNGPARLLNPEAKNTLGWSYDDFTQGRVLRSPKSSQCPNFVRFWGQILT